MSEHMMIITRGKLSASDRKIADRVAKENGCSWAGNPELPGQGFSSWFTCENLGEPFNGRTRAALLAALKSAGFSPVCDGD